MRPVGDTRRPRNDRRGAERRRAIIDAAIEVFGRRGFRTATLNEVAEHAGISAAGILYHFKTKDDLLFAVIRDRDRRQRHILDELTKTGGLAPLTAAVRFAEIGEDEPQLMALHTVLEVESLDPESPAHEYFRVRNEFLLEGVEVTLKALQRSGEIRSDVDCRRTAAQILAFEHGAALLWLKTPGLSITQLYRDYFDALVLVLTSPNPVLSNGTDDDASVTGDGAR